MDKDAAGALYRADGGKGKPIDSALGYASAGLRVFPAGRKKKPLTEHGFKDASTDETVIRAWWGRWPHADPAWAVPGDVVVLDLDIGKGDGVRDFVAREVTHPDAVATPQATTPSGGRHLVFAANGAAYRNWVGVNGAAIDVRTEGGYVILPAPATAVRG
jgi:hypothetical protein